MWSCKQALQGHSGSGRKKEGELAVTSQELNSTSVPPVAPCQQSCQFWPISMEWKCALNVNKYRNSAKKINFSWVNETAVKRWNTRKLLSSRFHRQVIEGARSKDEHSKSGKPPLAPALALGIETTGCFVSLVAYLEFRILFLQKCFETKMSRTTK